MSSGRKIGAFLLWGKDKALSNVFQCDRLFFNRRTIPLEILEGPTRKAQPAARLTAKKIAALSVLLLVALSVAVAAGLAVASLAGIS